MCVCGYDAPICTTRELMQVICLLYVINICCIHITIYFAFAEFVDYMVVEDLHVRIIYIVYNEYSYVVGRD